MSDARGFTLRPSVEQCLTAWAALVEANREQVERLREWQETPDFYAPVASAFKADPDRTGDDSLDALRELARADDVWLDVGAGGGRYALGLARTVRRVIAVEPSAGMRAILAETAEEHAITNVEVIDARWPMLDAPAADVALIAHVGYDIGEIGPFLTGLEQSASRLCIAMQMERQPGSGIAPLWRAVHGEPRAELPSVRELTALLFARGFMPEVRVLGTRGMDFTDWDDAIASCRRRLWLEEGSAKDQRMIAVLPDYVVARSDGRYGFRDAYDRVFGVLWDPGARTDWAGIA